MCYGHTVICRCNKVIIYFGLYVLVNLGGTSLWSRLVLRSKYYIKAM